MKEFKVAVVIVTYGERANFLSRVLDRCDELEAVSYIVVVDNNSKFGVIHNSEKIHIVKQDINTGSACGIAIGIEYVIEELQADYLWLLDDDNLPDISSLDVLLKCLGSQESDRVIPQSFRPNFLTHKLMFSSNGAPRKVKVNNCFLDFSIKGAALRKFCRKYTEQPCRDPNYHKTPYSQYGGLLINRRLVGEVGYPRSDYFLYADDSEYTYRMTRLGYEIRILKDSIVIDIDLSWNNRKEPSSFFSKFRYLTMGSDFRVYYAVRNSVAFEREYFAENNFEYHINRLTYLTMLFISALITSRLNRFRLILSAVNDGYHGRLGKKKDLEAIDD